jgi:hypothetical protein
MGRHVAIMQYPLLRPKIWFLFDRSAARRDPEIEGLIEVILTPLIV